MITIGFAIGIGKVDLSAIGIDIDCQLLEVLALEMVLILAFLLLLVLELVWNFWPSQAKLSFA